jgi:hypothetical protein
MCPKPGHVGADGVLSHFCEECNCLACLRCGVDSHVAVKHTIVPASVEAGRRVALRSGDLEVLCAGRDVHSAAAAKLRVAAAELATNRQVAIDALGAKHAQLVQQLQQAHDAAVAAVHTAYATKLAALTASLMQARCTTAHLSTVAAGLENVGPGTAPAFTIHISDTARACLVSARTDPPPPVDTTLRVRPDGRDPVFPLGVVVTADIDVEKSEIRLDGPAPAGLEEGSQLHATLTLRDDTGAPSLDDASAVDITVDVIESSTRDGASEGGAGASSGAGAGTGAGTDTSSTALSFPQIKHQLQRALRA